MGSSEGSLPATSPFSGIKTSEMLGKPELLPGSQKSLNVYSAETAEKKFWQLVTVFLCLGNTMQEHRSCNHKLMSMFKSQLSCLIARKVSHLHLSNEKKDVASSVLRDLVRYNIRSAWHTVGSWQGLDSQQKNKSYFLINSDHFLLSKWMLIYVSCLIELS